MPNRPSRRVALASFATTALAVGLGGCGSAGFSALSGDPAAVPPPAPGGGVRIGLILPLGAGGNGAATAAALKNAAELALSQFDSTGVQLIVKDDQGTPEGARAAAEQAVAEGADIILGPLFASSVTAAGAVARGAGRPVIAFSTDVNAASKGVYLLSFLPETEIDRVVSYTVSQGRKSFAALIPENPYGQVAGAEFQQAVARAGGTIVALERFPLDRVRMEPIVTKVAAVQANALFIPADGEVLAAVAPHLGEKRFDPDRVKPIGTGVWNEPRVLGLKELQGGWFAAPDSAGFNSFATRYKAKFGTSPARIATLSYDAMSLVVALSRTQGAQRFTEATLTNPSGFSGADGVFRFRANGTNERGLAVLEVRSGGARVVSAAPKSFAAGT